MNAERLLDAFDRLGDEPEAVQQFRKLVVCLAMSGKLVPPDQAELTPSSLRKEIEARKRALVQQGSLRTQSPLSSVSHEDLPKGFTSPPNFIRLGEIARIEKGQTGIMKAEPGPYPLVVTAEERGTCDHFDFDGAAAIVPLVSSAGHGKASLQRLHYQEGKFALGSILAAIFPHAPELISARFLFEYLAAFKDELLVSQMIGTANVSLSVGKVADVPVPLVPPLVQRKVDELMGLCDRLEAAREAREMTRDRLAAASFARLNGPDPETFPADALFAIDALSALTTRTDQIKALRQTILNLAVRGKLVPQDPHDEPASELLERRRRKGGNAKLRRTVPEMVAVPSKLRSEQLPTGWCLDSVAGLLRVGAITDLKDGNHGANHPKVSDFVDEGLPFITAAQVSEAGQIDYEGAYKLAGPPLDKLRVGFAQAGDVIYTHKGSVGRVALCDRDCVLSPQTTYYRLDRTIINDAFLRIVLLSDQFKDQVDAVKKQTTRDFVSIQKQYEFFLYLPPLAEQHRIVTKADALMALCDRLEASLAATAATRRRLLDAMLTEALAPKAAFEVAA